MPVGNAVSSDTVPTRSRPFTLRLAGEAEPAPRSALHLADRQARSRPDGDPDSGLDSGSQLKISVVIPTKNEARNLPGVLSQLPTRLLHEIVVVDGGSWDGTVSVARRLCPDAVIVRQTRRGKGNALSCGIAACTGDVIVTMDADGSTDPAEIPAFVAALAAGCDFVKGSRYLDGGGSTDLTPLRRAGNRVLAFAMNALYGASFSDLCYGYTAFRARCVDRLGLPGTAGAAAERGDGFEIETLIAAHAASARLKLGEVPSFEHQRRFGQSHLRTWSDGWRVLCTIVSERGRPRRPAAVVARAANLPARRSETFDAPPTDAPPTDVRPTNTLPSDTPPSDTAGF
jgi:hypothetical protein